MNRLFVAAGVSLLLSAAVVSGEAQESAPLTLIKSIPLADVQGRFDHFAIDVPGRRLFVAALGNNTLEVLDLKTGNRLKSIPGLHKPTGVFHLPEANRIFVANGEDGSLKVFDGASFQLVKRLGALDDADNVRYDAKTKLLYVGQGDGALAVIDVTRLNPTARIRLAGHPESFQLERQGPRIFVNVPEAGQIAVVDREKRTVSAVWPMKTYKANFPMALNETAHRLYIGCRSPARLVVVDTTTGNTVTDVPIGGDIDDLFYDARRKRLYASCGEGVVNIIQEQDTGVYKLLAAIPTAPGARTSFYSPESDTFYLAVPASARQPAEIRIYNVAE